MEYLPPETIEPCAAYPEQHRKASLVSKEVGHVGCMETFQTPQVHCIQVVVSFFLFQAT